MLSRNGFKSAWFGPRYWIIFHTWANQPKKKKILKRFYETPQYLLPCIYCRTSYGEFISRYALDDYLNRLPEWVVLIHNQVNQKLEKPCVDLGICSQYQLAEKEWIAPMWDMLFTTALNYPAQFNFWTNFPRISNEEKARYAAYQWFFTNLGEIIPDGKIAKAWKQTTRQYPCTAYALSSRRQLVSWLHQVAQKTGYWTLDLVTTIQYYEKYRASGCSATSKSCA